MLEVINNNQGIIAVIGLLIVLPLAIMSDKIISISNRRKYRRELKEILLKELWINMNHVSQIESSYKNQLIDLQNLHIPHYPPRTHVLSKFIEYNTLSSLNKTQKEVVIEIYQQLEDLKYEFFVWKDNLHKIEIVDEHWYIAYSSTILSYIDPCMRNMVDLWIMLVKEIGGKTTLKQIKDVHNIILTKIKEGKWIRSSYKSSSFNNEEYMNIDKFDVILCWVNDWEDCNKETIEIRDTVAIFDSWKKND